MKNGEGELRKFSVDRGRQQVDIIASFKHYYVFICNVFVCMYYVASED